MAVDMFMKIDDVKGESVDAEHKDQIDILAWSWGAQQTGSAHVGGGAGAGKAAVQDLTFQMHVEKSTPVLLGMCLTGKAFQQAQLVVRKAGGKPLEYIKIVMKEGLVSHVSFSGSGGDAQTVSVSLNFGKVELHYTPQAKDGSGQAQVSTSYDITQNKAG